MYMAEKRSIRILNRSTTIRLERPFWQVLERIAETQGIGVNELISKIDEDRRLSRPKENPENRNLASCLRVFCLFYLSEQNQMKLQGLPSRYLPAKKNTEISNRRSRA